MHFQLHLAISHRSEMGDFDFERILLGSLERFQHRLKHVYLHIEDVNGPRGGIDKQCRCVIHVHRMPPIVIQDQDDNLSTMVYRVANRAAYALSQKSDRRNKRALRERDHIRQRWAQIPANNHIEPGIDLTPTA